MFKINIKIGVNVLATNETLAHDPLGLFLRTSRLMTGGRSQSKSLCHGPVPLSLSYARAFAITG